MQKQIVVQLSDRLIPEIPRFFGGMEAAIKELFQNAYRAGATRVEVSVVDKVMRFWDNGRGCADPEVLLQAGGTGWDESKVVEPAGLGFFSLFGSNVSTKVRVESAGWRVEMIPSEVLAKHPILVDEAGEVTEGTRVTVNLVDDRDVVALVGRARGWYPFEVVCNGEYVPVCSLQDAIRVESEVGTVLFSPPSSQWFQHSWRPRAVWDYREIEGMTFRDALVEAAKGDVQRELAQWEVRWFVDAACGAKPKLPDRNDMTASDELTRAAGVVLAAMEEHLIGLARELTAGWAAVVTEPKGPFWLIRAGAGHSLLRRLGWEDVSCWDYRDYNAYEAGDEWEAHARRVVRFVRDFVRVADSEVAASMNLARHMGAEVPFAVEDEDGGWEVATDGLQGVVPVEYSSSYGVSIAKEIRVGDACLPFIFAGDEGVVVAADAMTALRLVQGRTVKLPGFVEQESFLEMLEGHFAVHVGDDFRVVDGNGAWDTEEFHQHLEAQVARDFLTAGQAEAMQVIHRAQRDLTAVGNAQNCLVGLGVELREEAEAARTELAALHKKWALEIARVAREAGIPLE